MPSLTPIIEAYLGMLNGNKTEKEFLEEKLITFGGQAYPKFGHVVIMAGGAGSGKGFVQEELVGLEGRTFDVDKLKLLSTRIPAIIRRVDQELGIDITKLDVRKNRLALKDPDNVSLLHEIVGDALNIPDRRQQAFFTSVLAADSDRKPNIIFDVTLKDLRKLSNISRSVSNIGYQKKNIHIVWVVNNIEVAIAQNMSRDRTVPAEILVNTHRGVSATMQDILGLGEDLKRYMDGDIVFAFNQIDVDTNLEKSRIPPEMRGTFSIKGDKKIKGGKRLTKADYVYVKRSGQTVTPLSQLSDDLKRKVDSYVPPNVSWIDS